MSVYIGELHTEIVPAGGGSPPAPQQGGLAAAHVAAERHREAAERAAWLAARVAAEDFDD
ncbi:hypothetical protein [Streptomyces sp. AP-93]|uniref:hypothetical protein n=1 Tax=Streptomyces sp. AP-93 TaxID=2929048 RepID=UPI001FB02368|nr:hypothetical protein [Streptomyces sp. AP-93]MCJ0874256.1 hypothetical protein [Streptomyces sp. AP-93]